MATQPFEAIVSQHSAMVLRVCRGVLGPHVDADDAWAETFLAAMRAYPELPHDANVEAWLVRIAHRKAIDITRTRQRQPTPVDELPDAQSVIGIPGDADRGVWAKVEALPDKQRRAISYHFLAGLPYRDVAEILGGTADAARRAAADGINTLRRELAGARTEGKPDE